MIDHFGLLAKKSLGQNFLYNQAIVRRIAHTAGDLTHLDVFEVGPGPGGLTRALLEAGARRLVAVEKDPRCLDLLGEIARVSNQRLEVLPGDALKIKPQDVIDGPLKIVANLPYNIGTVLLIQWLHDLRQIQSLTLMFQKEVALRIVGKPNTKDYGRLSVLCQWLCDVRRVFDLSPSAFVPAPKVTSSVVHLVPRNLPAADLALMPTLEKLTHDAFGQRRKMLRSSLKGWVTSNQFAQAEINPENRAEDLNVADFVRLARVVSGGL